MFGRRYFGGRYFGGRYFGDGGAAVVVVAADVREAVRLLLVQDAAVAALVGDRVRFGDAREKDGAPYLTAELTGDDRPWSLTGPVGSGAAEIRIDAWGATRREAVDTAEAARARLANYSGVVSGRRIYRIKPVDAEDEHQRVLVGSDLTRHRVRVSYLVRYRT